MKKQNGITLIALVITIIVLLILAGVSISAITGENGIIEKARQAKEETEAAQKKEEEDLQSVLDYMDGSVEEESGCPIHFDEVYIVEVENDFYYAYVFYEDGSADFVALYHRLVTGSEKVPVGTVGYDGLNIIDTSNNGTVIGTISTDGKEIYMGDSTLRLDTSYTSTYIPAGGTYYVDVTSTTLGDYTGAIATYTEGDKFPRFFTDGDVYVYGDYEYRYHSICGGEEWMYHQVIDGWGVRVLDNTKTSYQEILSSINGSDIFALYGTFVDCTALTILPTIPNGVVSIESAFQGTAVTDLSNYVIPDSVEDVGYAFSNCTGLILPPKMPNNLEWMYGTFSGCTSLTTAPIIPDTVRDMQSAFYNCESLNTYYGSSDNDGDFSNYIIPDGVENMNATFYNCKSLITAPVLPSSVTNIVNTFFGCSSLSGVLTINSTLENCSYSGCIAGTQITEIMSECSEDIKSAILAEK